MGQASHREEQGGSGLSKSGFFSMARGMGYLQCLEGGFFSMAIEGWVTCNV